MTSKFQEPRNDSNKGTINTMVVAVAVDETSNDDTSNTGNGSDSLVGYRFKEELQSSPVGQKYHNIDLDSEQPVSDAFDDDDAECPTQMRDELDKSNRKRWKLNYLWDKCFHCICPFLVIFRALLRCDMDTFWRIVPSILVAKAFYSSCVTLGLCTLFKVQRRKLNYDTPDSIENDTSNFIEETYFFGLWTYTGDIDMGNSVEDFLEKEVERVETCRFRMNQVDAESPDRLFLNDLAFNIARAFAIVATVLGFVSMVSLYLTVANCSLSCRGSKIWLLFYSLIACGIFQSFAFLVFASSVCRDIEFDDNRHCSLEEGAGIIFMSCFCSWFAAFASLKMPRYSANEEGCIPTSIEPKTECAKDTGDTMIKEVVDPIGSGNITKGTEPQLSIGLQMELVEKAEQKQENCYEMGNCLNDDDTATTTASGYHSPIC